MESEGGAAVAREGQPLLLSVRQVAGLVGCGPQHIRRLSDVGRMPRPMKVGRLVRWRRAEIKAWIADGCKPVNKGGAQQW